MLCFQRSFQNQHGLNLCFALSFDISAPGDCMARAWGVQHRRSSELSHRHKEALGDRRIITSACSKEESSKPGATQGVSLWPQEVLRNDDEKKVQKPSR